MRGAAAQRRLFLAPPLGELRPAAAGGRRRRGAISAAAPLAGRSRSRPANGIAARRAAGCRRKATERAPFLRRGQAPALRYGVQRGAMWASRPTVRCAARRDVGIAPYGDKKAPFRKGGLYLPARRSTPPRAKGPRGRVPCKSDWKAAQLCAGAGAATAGPIGPPSRAKKRTVAAPSRAMLTSVTPAVIGAVSVPSSLPCAS